MARYLDDINDYSDAYNYISKNIQLSNYGEYFLIICFALGVTIGYKKYNSPIIGGFIGLLIGIITILLISFARSNIFILAICCCVVLYIILNRIKNNRTNISTHALNGDAQTDTNSIVISNLDKDIQNTQDKQTEKTDVETLLKNFEKALSERKAQNKKNENALKEKGLNVARRQIEIAFQNKKANVDYDHIRQCLSQYIDIEKGGEIRCHLCPKNSLYIDFSDKDSLKSVYITDGLSKDEKFKIYKLWYEINKNNHDTYWEDWYNMIVKKL